LTIYAARPSCGKSSLGLQVAAHASFGVPSKPHKVLFFSLEMPELELADRILSMTARVNLWKMRNGHTTQHDRSLLIEAASDLAASNLYLRDDPHISAHQIAAVCRRQKRKRGLDLVIIDYVQLIQPQDVRDSREQQVAKIARRLKLMARELDVPVVCLAQLNRAGDAGGTVREPRLSDLRESGALEQDSDNVVFIHRPPAVNEETPQNSDNGSYEPQSAKLLIAKQRNGPCGPVEVQWTGAYARFDNPAGHPGTNVPISGSNWEPEPPEESPDAYLPTQHAPHPTPGPQF
jgi:replicative DNA helicase